MTVKEMAKWNQIRAGGKQRYALQQTLLFVIAYGVAEFAVRHLVLKQALDCTLFRLLAVSGSIVIYFAGLRRWEKCETVFLASRAPDRELGA